MRGREKRLGPAPAEAGFTPSVFCSGPQWLGDVHPHCTGSSASPVSQPTRSVFWKHPQTHPEVMHSHVGIAQPSPADVTLTTTQDAPSRCCRASWKSRARAPRG